MQPGNRNLCFPKTSIVNTGKLWPRVQWLIPTVPTVNITYEYTRISCTVINKSFVWYNSLSKFTLSFLVALVTVTRLQLLANRNTVNSKKTTQFYTYSIIELQIVWGTRSIPHRRALQQGQYRVSVDISLCHNKYIYRVIHKSLRKFRTRLRNNQDRHGRKEHINR